MLKPALLIRLTSDRSQTSLIVTAVLDSFSSITLIPSTLIHKLQVESKLIWPQIISQNISPSVSPCLSYRKVDDLKLESLFDPHIRTEKLELFIMETGSTYEENENQIVIGRDLFSHFSLQFSPSFFASPKLVYFRSRFGFAAHGMVNHQFDREKYSKNIANWFEQIAIGEIVPRIPLSHIKFEKITFEGIDTKCVSLNSIGPNASFWNQLKGKFAFQKFKFNFLIFKINFSRFSHKFNCFSNCHHIHYSHITVNMFQQTALSFLDRHLPHS